MSTEEERTQWRERLNISNFINSYYQYRDCESLGDIRRILVVGPGQGLDTAIFCWRGKEVATLDVDSIMRPDHLGSVTDLSRFATGEWDLLTASHILEHIPPAQLDTALAEIARVSRHALIYLPMAGRFSRISIMPGTLRIDLRIILDWINPWSRIDPHKPLYRSGEHYWEVGLRGYRVADLVRRLSAHFQILQHYRNTDWPQSYNFVLRSLQHGR